MNRSELKLVFNNCTEQEKGNVRKKREKKGQLYIIESVMHLPILTCVTNNSQL